MNVALWIVAGVLAAAYTAAGIGKLILSRQRFAQFKAGGWADDFSDGVFKLIGVLEILGGIGLVVPAVLDIAPDLVPVAALGLMMVMSGAVTTRLRRNELKLILGDLLYLALMGFVAYGRLGPERFSG